MPVKQKAKSMASKLLTTVFALSFLLFIFSTAHAARPHPGSSNTLPATTQHGGVDDMAEETMVVAEEDGCEGAGEEEHCLMGRTLAAHVDYIYTDKQTP